MIIDEYIKYDLEYKEKYGINSLVLMQVGSFYEMYSINSDDNNFKKVCNLMNIVCTKKNKNISIVDVKNPYMAGFPTISLIKYVQILIDNYYHVIIYNQRETLRGKQERYLLGIYSYETYIEDLDNKNIFSSDYNLNIEDKEDKHIISLYFDKKSKTIGISIIDVYHGLIYNYKNPNISLNEIYPIIELYPTRKILISGNTENINLDLNANIKKININNLYVI